MAGKPSWTEGLYGPPRGQLEQPNDGRCVQIRRWALMTYMNRKVGPNETLFDPFQPTVACVHQWCSRVRGMRERGAFCGVRDGHLSQGVKCRSGHPASRAVVGSGEWRFKR
jgi:hypothetical protein